MEIKWLNPDASFDRLVLVGDVGGTNTNLGLVGVKAGKFTLILETVYPSNEVTTLGAPLLETMQLAKARRADLAPTQCCISGAGPVEGNHCTMTNLKWDIDGNALTKELGLPVLVINDFLAISYGIPTLDVNDPAQIHALRHMDGSVPAPKLATKAVIGPGTGLGVSFLAWDGKGHVPASSEGGHMTFAAFDAESMEFQQYIQTKLGDLPGVEPLVSGMGIRNLYAFYRDTGKLPKSDLWAQVEALPENDRPGFIAKSSASDPIAAELMQRFVRMLARYASDVSVLLLPFGGFYLAGGVVQKNLHWLEKDNLFMRAFEQNYNPNIKPLLSKVPVYVIKDYSISLYGAANASLHLQ